VELVTADQPDAPDYFTYDAVLNTQERPTLSQALERELTPLELSQALELGARGAQLVDTRDPVQFEGAHLAGSVNIGLGGSFATWCGTILDTERPIVLIADPGRELEAATRLGRIGFDNVAGFLQGGMQAVEDDDRDEVGRTDRITADSLREQLGSEHPPLVIDVRTAGEWTDRHIDGSANVPLSRLAQALSSLPADRPVVVYC